MSLLRPPGADDSARASGRQSARRSDRDRRRFRRQRGISVDDRGPRRLAGLEGGAAGEDRLRPRRRHARDDQAASVRRPPPHRRHAGRPSDRHGHRRPPRRRRLRDALPRGSLARRDPRDRSLSLRPHSHSRPRGDDEHAAQRRVSRLRRAADPVRGRGAHGSHRRRARRRSGAFARDQRFAPGRHDRDRTEARARLQRPGRAARGGAANRFPAAAPAAHGHEPGDRPGALLPRLGLHRRRRGEARLEGVSGAHTAGRADPRRLHRDRTGHAHHARADRRRRARRSLRLHRRGGRRHRPRPRQRDRRSRRAPA